MAQKALILERRERERENASETPQGDAIFQNSDMLFICTTLLK